MVSGIASLNERLWVWVDSQLHPIMKSIKWQQNYVWVTADVASLYSVIPHDLTGIVLFLNTYSTYSLVLKHYIIDVVRYLLRLNFFMFNKEFFLQVTGASMGVKFSPSLANVCGLVGVPFCVQST